jgi:hypothetical protein
MDIIVPPVTWAYSSKDEDAKPPILKVDALRRLEDSGVARPDKPNAAALGP